MVPWECGTMMKWLIWNNMTMIQLENLLKSPWKLTLNCDHGSARGLSVSVSAAVSASKRQAWVQGSKTKLLPSWRKKHQVVKNTYHLWCIMERTHLKINLMRSVFHTCLYSVHESLGAWAAPWFSAAEVPLGRSRRRSTCNWSSAAATSAAAAVDTWIKWFLVQTFFDSLENKLLGLSLKWTEIVPGNTYISSLTMPKPYFEYFHVLCNMDVEAWQPSCQTACSGLDDRSFQIKIQICMQISRILEITKHLTMEYFPFGFGYLRLTVINYHLWRFPRIDSRQYVKTIQISPVGNEHSLRCTVWFGPLRIHIHIVPPTSLQHPQHF